MNANAAAILSSPQPCGHIVYRAVLDFFELGTKSDEFLAAFKSNTYRQINDFVWIDQISLVRSQNRVDALDGMMLSRVKQTNFEFSPPDMIEWDRGPTFACVVRAARHAA